MSLLAAPPPSATLATNERVQARLAAGVPVLHLAFGEAGLPVLPSVAERLGAAAGENSYGPVAGSLRGPRSGGRLLRAPGTAHRSRADPAGSRQQGAALRAALRAAR